MRRILGDILAALAIAWAALAALAAILKLWK